MTLALMRHYELWLFALKLRRRSTMRAWSLRARGLSSSPKRTEADFQEWRDQQTWTAENIVASIAASACLLTGDRHRQT